jgi:uncharacterized Zn-binding protein involved in type VI secretion
MPPQARLGDQAEVPSDSHGCLCCAHDCVGPAIQGSPNVNVNGKPAIRVTDPGTHSACCGANTWKAQSGSSTVMINNLAAHRENDQTIHCGGQGTTIEGSPNVITGG